VLPVKDGEAEPIAQAERKALYVSPFMTNDMTYDFRVLPPGDRVVVAVMGRDGEGPLILATLIGARRELSDSALLRVLFTHPLVTLKVIAGIHWEALLLWWKGVAVRPRPACPASTRPIGSSETSASRKM
jgi:DUF1365 family protein